MLSALCSCEKMRNELEDKICKMEEEQAEVLKIMIQNSMMLGQDVSGGGSSARSWRTS